MRTIIAIFSTEKSAVCIFNKKKLFTVLLLSFILISVTFPQNYWERIPSPTTQRLNSIVFADNLNGWVCGDSGVIFHTSNAGENWDIQFSNDTLNLVNLFFLDNQKGWAAGWSMFYEPYGTFILTTTNGGLNWRKEIFNVGEKCVNSFYFLDTLKGFAVGYPNLFIRTTDGGISWNKVNLDSALLSGFPPFTVKFLNNKYGYVCGGLRNIAGVVWRTTDGGSNWATVVNGLTPDPLYDLHIFDSLHIIVMGGDPRMGASEVVTFDGGNTWQYTQLGTLGYPVDIDFRTATEGWAPLGCQRKFLYSSDSGETWNELETPDSAAISGICFPDSSHGFGIGQNGEMVRYVYPAVPVELVSFGAFCSDGTVILEWQTETETNNKGFEVERSQISVNKSDWKKIGYLSGFGTTTELNSYSFLDKDVISGEYSYRLKQVDFDGSYKYSKVVNLKVTAPALFYLEQNYPNPFNPATMIRYSIPVDQHIALNVYNLLGQKVMTLVDGMQKQGKQEVKFNATSVSGRIASGVYFYKLEAGTQSSIKKMILMK